MDLSHTTVPAPLPRDVTADQAPDAVRDAVVSGVPLADYGVAHGGVGHPPPTPHTPLRQVGDVIEHYERDFAVRAAGGCTLGTLREALDAAGQWLPLDADDDLTLGECVSCNVYGPLRLSYGGPRDLLLGLAFVDGEGRVIRVGGRTVKNVAGLDVTKLQVGALGELGFITEVTLRTYAVPEATLIADLELHDPQAVDELLPRWLTTDAAPAWLALSSDAPSDPEHAGSLVARVGFHGSGSGPMVQLQSLRALLEGVEGIRIEGAQQYPFQLEREQRAARRHWRREASALLKLVVPPAATAFIARTMSEPPAGDPRREVEAYPAHGCVWVGGPLNADQARRLDQQATHVLQPTGGFRVWHRRPPQDDQDQSIIQPFTPPPADLSMLRRLKSALDPHRVLNPGRML